MSTMRQIIGKNAQQHRSRSGWTQAQFAAQLKLISGREWSVNAISEAESGKRTWAADDVVLFSRALQLDTPGDLFDIPLDVTEVEIDGESVPRDAIQSADHALNDGSDAPLQVINSVARGIARTHEQIEELLATVEVVSGVAMNAKKKWLRRYQGSEPVVEDGNI